MRAAKKLCPSPKVKKPIAMKKGGKKKAVKK